jgi:hypothetical protein
MSASSALTPSRLALADPLAVRRLDAQDRWQRERGQTMASKHEVRVRRVYGEKVRGDGARVLVDRIWPRGLSKEKADLHEWCKPVAPSTTLRKR